MGINRILVVNVNWIGDVIFSLPIFKALKRNYPESEIACLAVPRVKKILEASHWVDEIIVYDEKGKHRNPLAKLRLIRELRRKKFQIAFLLHRSWTRALLVFLAGIPERIGYDTKGRGLFLTHRVKSLSVHGHRSDYYLNVLESYGIKVEDRGCELNVLPEPKTQLDQLLHRYDVKREDILIVINPGGNWNLKRWPKENFALLINRLSNEVKAKIIISGADKDYEFALEIAQRSQVNPIVLAGQTDLLQLVTLMKRANLVISADTGPLHLASSVGTDIIGLFGPTKPEMTGPRGKGRIKILHHDVGCNREPCYFLTCPDNICMQSVTVEDVMEAVHQMVQEKFSVVM